MAHFKNNKNAHFPRHWCNHIGLRALKNYTKCLAPKEEFRELLVGILGAWKPKFCKLIVYERIVYKN